MFSTESSSSLVRKAFTIGAVALMAALPVRAAIAEDDATAGSGKKAGAFVAPWNRWGTVYVGAGGGLGSFQKHTDSNNDGSLSAIDADDSDLDWNVRVGSSHGTAASRPGMWTSASRRSQRSRAAAHRGVPAT